MNIFRALAIFLVVGAHSYGSSHPFFGKFFLQLFEHGTVLFVFIAGFLFQYLSDTFEYKTYLKKKFINVISPYLFTSIIGIAGLLAFPSSNPLNGINELLQIPMFLTSGSFHNGPTWYIPMICLFFLCAKWLIKWRDYEIGGKSVLYSSLIVLIFISLLVPRISVPWIMVGTPWQMYIKAEINILCSFVVFFPIYVLGMFFASYRRYIPVLYERRKILWFLTIASWLFVLFGCNHWPIITRLMTAKVFFTLVALGYLERYDKVFLAHPNINKMLDLFATYSFSIFFLHTYLLRLLSGTLHYLLHIHPDIIITNVPSFLLWFAMATGRFCVAFIGSLLVAFVAKKILTKMGIKNTRFFIGA